MQHEEHDQRHPHHWEQQRHRRDQQRPMHPQHQDNFNDFGSRWGEPVTPLNQHQQDDWQPRRADRFRQEGNYRQEEWRPNEQDHRRQQPPHNFRHEQHHEPMWRQRDVHFDPSNQRVEDRWSEDPTMPHPRQRPPRHYDGFWQDYED
ncbi:hypothetical protein [Pontibacter rugosus]|uniref:Uncharacterized protein n=1 Tax=Pontibacter rugosus TaxID=1745966 RepID=A0ABW3SL26_9BACT